MRYAWLALLLLGCAPKSKPSFKFLPPATAAGITVSNESAEESPEGILIYGDLKNGEHEMRRVFVLYDCLDAQGRKVDEIAAESKQLSPGQTWRFRSITAKKTTVQFRCREILTEWKTN